MPEIIMPAPNVEGQGNGEMVQELGRQSDSFRSYQHYVFGIADGVSRRIADVVGMADRSDCLHSLYVAVGEMGSSHP